MVLTFQVLTLFPEIFSSFLMQSLLKKAVDGQLVNIQLINYRKYGLGKRKTVDDLPYGGGAGMVLCPGPIVQAIRDCDRKAGNQQPYKILVTPQGIPFAQKDAEQLSQSQVPLVIICGRYEGFDERIRQFVDVEISIGDFILLGGEVAAMAMIEAICRLIPGVIGNPRSLDQESFEDGLLEHAQYTRPLEFFSYRVPDVLLSGDHKKIEEWRQQNSLQRTKQKRPDLFCRYQEKRELTM